MKKYKNILIVLFILVVLLCLLEHFQVGTPKDKEPEYTTITLEKEPDFIGSTYNSDKLAIVSDGNITIFGVDGSSEKIELDINVKEAYPYNGWIWIIDQEKNLYKLEIDNDVYCMSEIILEDVLCLESNNVQTAAINSKGELYVWGNNEYGDLGVVGQKYIDVPTKVEYVDGVKEIKLCDMHSALVTNSGELYVAGCGWDGSIVSNEFVEIELSKKVDYIERDHKGKCIAVFNDGSAMAWICLAAVNGKQVELYYDENTIYETEYKSISYGLGFTAGVTQDGELFYWGNDFLSGKERKSDYNTLNTPSEISGITNVEDCYGGEGVIYAKSNLKIYIVKE